MSTRFLDPATLARIGNLELLAKTVVGGFLSGLHRSPWLGFSSDFAEHRPYMPGDDVRRIDWRLYARSDRHHIRLFEAETNANVVVVLDVSRSMDFGTGPLSRFDYSRFLAACLAHLSNRQRDRVGLLTVDDAIVDRVPPSMKHLDTILAVLDRATPEGEGSLCAAMAQVTELLKRRGIVALISDFYEDPDALLEAVGALGARGHDLIVFHPVDPAELEFPYADASAFEELEGGAQLPVIPGRVRSDYVEHFQLHLSRLRDGFRELQADYTTVKITEPLDQALFEYLLARGRRTTRGRGAGRRTGTGRRTGAGRRTGTSRS